MKRAVIIRTTNYSTDFKLYVYPNLLIAMSQLRELFLQEIREAPSFDYNNTYLSEDGKYGQVSYGLGNIEFRVSELEACKGN